MKKAWDIAIRDMTRKFPQLFCCGVYVWRADIADGIFYLAFGGMRNEG